MRTLMVLVLNYKHVMKVTDSPSIGHTNSLVLGSSSNVIYLKLGKKEKQM